MEYNEIEALLTERAVTGGEQIREVWQEGDMDLSKMEKQLEESWERIDEKMSNDDRWRAWLTGIPLLVGLAVLVWVIRQVLVQEDEYRRMHGIDHVMPGGKTERRRASADWRSPFDRRAHEARQAPVGAVRKPEPEMAGEDEEAPARMKTRSGASTYDLPGQDGQAQARRDEDLTRIEGIGPKISAVLKKAGIRTFKELGETNSLRLTQILSEAGIPLGLANPETWPEQARLAAEGRWEDFEALKARLNRGRKTA